MSILRCEGVSIAFDGVHALSGVSIEFPDQGVVAIIGPNGAGKTTLLNVISGFVQPDHGRIWLRSNEITHSRLDRIARSGLTRTFQDLRLIPSISVLDNVLLYRQAQKGEGLLRGLLGFGWRHQEAANREIVSNLLHRVGLLEQQLRTRLAGELSYGQQKLLSLACCWAAESQVIFLDEPVAGVDPQVRENILDMIQTLAGEGRLIIFIEHDIAAVRNAAHRVIVMDEGHVVADGQPNDILRQRATLEAYLG